MENHEEDSDEAPEEISFKSGKEKFFNIVKTQNEAKASAKKKIKQKRTLIQKINELENKKKVKRLEELEERKLPEELLTSLETDTSKNDVERLPRPRPRVRPNRNKRRKKNKKTNEDHMVEIRSQSSQEENAWTLVSRAVDFKQQQLYTKKFKRIPSKRLRLLDEKLKEVSRYTPPALEIQ